jgi:hypothetical protein
MHVELMPAAAGWMELALLCLAAYTGFSRWGYTIAAAGAYAIMTVLMGLSFLFQICFLLGKPRVALAAEAICTGLALAAVIYRRRDTRRLIANLAGFAREHKTVALVLIIALIYLACQNLLLPPESDQWPALVKLLQIQKQGLFGHTPGGTAGPYLEPLNAPVLSHLFLRFHTDYGLGILGYLGYLTIAFASYALSRRYAWPPDALTVTLIVISMPRLVCHAATPGAEIIPAAASLFCVLAVHRLVERPNAADLLLLVLGILFSISGGKLGFVFPLILTLVSGMLLLRRRGFVFWWAMIRKSWIWLLAALPPAAVFCQGWLFAYNLQKTGEWVGSPNLPVFAYNAGGILGAAANSVRYLLESANLTQPIEVFCRWAFGFSPINFLQGLYRITLAPWLNGSGATLPYFIAWMPNDILAWFGPFGIVTVLPAIVYAAWRGPRRLKTIAVALIGYFYLVSLIVGWAPGNAAYFMRLFVCGGVCIAFLLPPWRITRVRRRVLQTLCFLLLVYTLAFNTGKPVAGSRLLQASQDLPPQMNLPEAYRPVLSSIGSSVWTLSDFGRNRWVYARRLFGDNRIPAWTARMPAGARIAVVAQNESLAYPFLLAAEEMHIMVVSPDALPDMERLRILAPEYLAYLDCTPVNLPPGTTHTTLWQADPAVAHFPGTLLRIELDPVH